jgi:hypothetical protein
MDGFLSYSHADQQLYAGFCPHLAALRRAFDLDIWTDHKIEPGIRWEARIADAIAAAQLFVLMITPDFIGSDYVFEKEIPAIQEQYRAGALVLPVVVRRCSWQSVAAALQATPTQNGKVKPIADWRPRDHGFDCAREQMMFAIESHFGMTRKSIIWGVA